jgi:hypothetical protein
MQSSTFVRRLALATGSILAHPAQGADFLAISKRWAPFSATLFLQLCNSAIVAARQPEARTVSHALCTISCGFEAFRAHTNLGRRFNLFKPLRRHFRATTMWRRP